MPQLPSAQFLSFARAAICIPSKVFAACFAAPIITASTSQESRQPHFLQCKRSAETARCFPFGASTYSSLKDFEESPLSEQPTKSRFGT